MIDAGLCAACRNARVVENRRGSRFWMCELSRTDTGFARYPVLPVLECRGFTRREEAVDDGGETKGETG